LRPRGSAALCQLAGERALAVAEPRRALCRVLELFAPAPRPLRGRAAGARVARGAKVHPGARLECGAIVESGARIGDGTRVEAGAVVGRGAVIGRGCRIGQNAVVLGCCRIGDRVSIGPGTVLGGEGFGFVEEGGAFRRIPQLGALAIEDDVEIGAHCTIDRGTLGETRIGAGSKLDAQVHIAHNVHIGRKVIIAAQCGLSGSVVVGDGAMLGGKVGVADHRTIGAGAQVGAGSGVGSHVPPGARVAGYPAVPIEDWLRSIAQARRRARQPAAQKGKP
jgi:UDP-3-O-[3-hydroxymyristoyl] glucosamine N-acyltransferase